MVTMNRDELRTRKESGLLYSRSHNDTRLFYPVDVLSGGTWFGANNRGVILALLNRYHAPETPGAKSRGDIIPSALEKGGLEGVSKFLHELKFSAYNPFDLFLVGKKHIEHFSWDGEHYLASQKSFKHWFMFTSSSLKTEEVIAYRKSLFNAWTSEMGKKLTDASELLRGYHMIQFEGMEKHSVLMEREKSHTKSIMQADVEGKKLSLKYLPDILEKSIDAPLADAQVEVLEIRKS